MQSKMDNKNTMIVNNNKNKHPRDEPEIIKLFVYLYCYMELGRQDLPIEECMRYSGLYIDNLPLELNASIGHYIFNTSDIDSMLEKQSILFSFFKQFPAIMEHHVDQMLAKFFKSVPPSMHKLHIYVLIGQLKEQKQFGPQKGFLIKSKMTQLYIERGMGWEFLFHNPSCRDDREIVERILAQKLPDDQSRLLRIINPIFLQDKKLVKLSVQHNPMSLEDAGHFCDDEEIVMCALENASTEQEKRTVLVYASDRLLDSETFVESILHLDAFHTGLRYLSYRLRNFKPLVLKAIKQNGEQLQYASNTLKDDEDVVRLACQSGGAYFFKQCSERLRNDKRTVECAVKHYGKAIIDANTRFRKDKGLFLTALKDPLFLKFIHSSPYNILGSFEDDEDVISAMCQHTGSLLHIPCLQFAGNRLHDKEPLVFKAVNSCGSNLKFVRQPLRNLKKIVKAAVTQTGFALQYASEEMSNNEEIVLIAFEQDAVYLRYAGEQIKNNAEFMLKATAIQKRSFFFASDNLKDNEKVVKAALELGCPFEYASSQRLRNMEKIVLFAMEKDVQSFEFASDRLRKDKNLFMKALECGMSLDKLCRISPRLFQEKELLDFLIRSCNTYSYTFLYLAKDILRDDKELLGIAAKRDTMALRFANEDIQNDEEFILSLKEDIDLEFVSERLADHKEIVMNALRSSSSSEPQFQYVSARLQDDKEVVLEALKKDVNAIEYAGERMCDDVEVMTFVVSQDLNAIIYASDRIKTEIFN